jgi:hypothetical protein
MGDKKLFFYRFSYESSGADKKHKNSEYQKDEV